MTTPRSLGWVAPEQRGRAPHAGVRGGHPGGFAALRPEVLLEHLPPVYDQCSVGSCTAQALACAVEALLPRAGYTAERPDRAALYRRERDMIGTAYEDSGAILADGVEVLRRGWERETIEPPPFSSIPGRKAWIVQNMLRTLRSKANCHCSSVASSTAP